MSARRNSNRDENGLLYQKFVAKVGQRDHEIEVAHDAAGYRARAAGSAPARETEAAEGGAGASRETLICWDEVAPGRVLLQVDGRPVEIRLTHLPDGALRIEKDGRQVLVRVEDDLAQRARLAHAHHGGPVPVRSPMPGMVVKILVEDGQAVDLEQPVMIIEAMKMQNEIPAPASGTVQSIQVRPGQAVDGDEVVMEIRV
jgi:biotin carboxyl carrier protein